MTTPLWNFGLSPEQGLKIATILANWSMVDNEVSHLIERTSGIMDKQAGAELVHAIDIRKKIEILDIRRKQSRLPPELQDLIKELAWVGKHYYGDRNMRAHGTISVSNTRAIAQSHSKQRTLDLSLLDAVLDESHYATWVAHNLFLRHLLVDPGPLPPKPPERPASP